MKWSEGLWCCSSQVVHLKADEMQGLADYLWRMQGPVRDRARMKIDGTVRRLIVMYRRDSGHS